MTLYTRSKTASSNATTDVTINWAEGQAPSSVNDSARATMAAVAKYRDDVNGSLTTGGTSTAYTLATNQVFDTPAHLDKQELTVVFNVTSGASPTLNVDGLGVRALNVRTGVAVPPGYFKAGTAYRLTYFNSSSEFIPQRQADVLNLGGALTVGGAATLSSTIGVTGGATLNSTLSVTDKASFTSTDSMAVANGTTAQRNGTPAAGDLRYNSTLNGVEYWNGAAWVILGQAPTIQKFTAGTTQTYTPPAGVVRIRVRMCGPGGGGGAATTNAGSAGSADTSFGSWTAVRQWGAVWYRNSPRGSGRNRGSGRHRNQDRKGRRRSWRSKHSRLWRTFGCGRHQYFQRGGCIVHEPAQRQRCRAQFWRWRRWWRCGEQSGRGWRRW